MPDVRSGSRTEVNAFPDDVRFYPGSGHRVASHDVTARGQKATSVRLGTVGFTGKQIFRQTRSRRCWSITIRGDGWCRRPASSVHTQPLRTRPTFHYLITRNHWIAGHVGFVDVFIPAVSGPAGGGDGSGDGLDDGPGSYEPEDADEPEYLCDADALTDL